MSTLVKQGEVHESTRLLSTMDRPDYIDFFMAATGDAATASPEQWARTAIEGAAGLGGQFIWRVVLGLRLQQVPNHVGGWRIGDQGDSWIRLEAVSWSMTAHIVIQVEDQQVSVATFIRYDRAFASLIWPPASVIHRRLMPGLLRHTVNLQTRRC